MVWVKERHGRILVIFATVIVALGSAWFLFRAPPITEDLARRYAQKHLERYGQAIGLDIKKFGEPRAVPVGGVPYGFEWVYSDEHGQVSVYILVEESGWTYLSFDGDVRRLIDQPIPDKSAAR